MEKIGFQFFEEEAIMEKRGFRLILSSGNGDALIVISKNFWILNFFFSYIFFW